MEHLVVDNTGKESLFLLNDRLKFPVFDAVLSKEAHYVVLSSEGVVILDKNGGTLKRLKSPVKLTSGVVRNNPEGDIAILANE